MRNHARGHVPSSWLAIDPVYAEDPGVGQELLVYSRTAPEQVIAGRQQRRVSFLRPVHPDDVLTARFGIEPVGTGGVRVGMAGVLRPAGQLEKPVPSLAVDCSLHTRPAGQQGTGAAMSVQRGA